MNLSEYQNATVEHLLKVYKNQKAYIVADEVGLGKTYVAIGLIEKLQAKRIIYIASNAEIAKQNVASIIDKSNDSIQMVPGDRLSMIDTNLSTEKNYIISLSPATTFTGIGSPVGTVEERNYYIEHIEDIKDIGAIGDEVIACLKAYNKKTASCRYADSKTKSCISKCRKLFNDYNLQEYRPDLIIMDEFHRFHSLLAKKPQDENAYSMWKTLEKSDCKVLLLSATPYTYSQDKIIRKYNIDTESVDEEGKDPDKAFGNFMDLINYLNDINGKDQIVSIPDISTIYETIMCRTQRNWLQDDSASVKKEIRPVIADADISRMAEHFAYLSVMRESLKVSEVIDERKKGKVTGDGSYGSFLDQAASFEQFGEKYKFSEYTKGNDKLERKRELFSGKLKENNHYLIRKKNLDKEDDFQIEPESFKKCLKEYKTQKLMELAMPAQCEMLLWVLPTILQSVDNSEWKPLGIADENIASLKLFSKTLVFAHYRLSTAAVSAITSMEANRRLDAIIDDALKSKYDQAVVDILSGKSNLPEKVIDIIKEVIANLTIDEEVIKKEIKNFFDTSYARKVLAAWSYLVNISHDKDSDCITYENVIEKYVENFKFKEMLTEYRDVVGEGVEKTIFTVKDKNKDRPGSIGWSDGERTKVIVFPDFVEKTYPLTFAERYYSDYSDKSSHDKNEKKGNPRLNTTKRLEAIRIRFQSPFYPFILVASETAQEGVDLHNYCSNIIHWSVPSSVRVYTQEEGRVDRRGSLAARRQMVELFNRWSHSKTDEIDTVEKMFVNAGKICKDLGLGKKIELAEKAGLFPKWFLPTDKDMQISHRLNSELFCIPFGNEYAAYHDLAYYVEQYVTFGIKEDSGKTYSDDKLRDGLCPFIMKLKQDEKSRNHGA